LGRIYFTYGVSQKSLKIQVFFIDYLFIFVLLLSSSDRGQAERGQRSGVRQPADLRVLAEVAASSEQPLPAPAPRDPAPRPLRARCPPRRYIEPINDEAPEESDEWQKPIPGVKQASVLSDSEDED